MGNVGGMFILSWMELLLIHCKYEPLPDSDDEYSDESEEEESDGLEYEGDSDAEGSRKRRLSTEPRRGKRRRLNEDDANVCVIAATEDFWTDDVISIRSG
jgi:hypothetical protein